MLMIKPKIINYTSKHQSGVASLVQEVKVKELGWPKPCPDLIDVRKSYNAGGGNFWLAIDKEEVVGSLGVKKISQTEGEVRRLYIKKRYRGTGLAQRMMVQLFLFAAETEMTDLYLVTSVKNIAAIKFYKKVGFKETLKVPKGFDFTGGGCFMKMRLSKP
jgi:ribosomal protein S18 acetylase RimI-like enzyme